MSWQRRPQSGMRSRPLSMLATENSASRNSSAGATDERPRSRDEPSRQAIAQSLGSKDPAFFRQTADRGLTSAAYRRDREDELDRDESSGKRQLPGLIKDRSVAMDGHSTPDVSTPSRFGSVRNSAFMEATIPEDSQSATSSIEPVSTPEADKAAIGRTMPSLHSRMSVDRPPSPTKGTGGFVQSAMLKRSDSVSKRWSGQPGGGLSRENSTASIRSGFGSIRNGVVGSNSMPRLDTARHPPELEARPESGDSTVSAMSNLTLQEPDVKAQLNRNHGSLHSRSKSMATLRDPPAPISGVREPFSPPLSPSKRFSPTKSSWLESALARPESPKPSLSQVTQPSWMADINKAKQQRNGAESPIPLNGSPMETSMSASRSNTPSNARNSTVFGNSALSRTSTMDLGISNLSPRTETPPTKAKPASLASKLPSEQKVEVSSLDLSTTESDKHESSTEPPVASSPPLDTVKSPSSPPRSHRPSSSTTNKPETPPKKDFRSNLKPRQTSDDTGPKENLEFRNALGKLKKAQTEKYVAPDMLKNNILRGKAGLATTDGPQKTQRTDELKESLVKRKEEMKAKAVEVPHEEAKKISPLPAPATPEALTRKKHLGRTESVLSVGASNPRRDITPEALSRHRTLRSKPDLRVPEKPSSLADVPVPPPFASKPSVQTEPSEKSSTLADKPAAPPFAAKPMAQVKVPEKLSKLADVPAPAPFARKASSETTKPEILSGPADEPSSGSFAMKPATKSSVAKPAESVTKPVEKPAAVPSPASLQPKDDSKINGALKSAKLADKFNPALAGILSRGPPGSSQAAPGTQSNGSQLGQPATSTSLEETASGQELTHMTKNRAKGPKRRKPNAKEETAVPETRAAKRPASIQVVRSATLPSPASPLQPPPKSAIVRAVSSTMSVNAVEKEKPVTPTKSASLSLKSTPTPEIKVSSMTQQKEQPTSASNRSSRQYALDAQASAAPADHRVSSGENKENLGGSSSVKAAAGMWGKQTAPPTSTSEAMPMKLPSREDEEAAMRSAGLLSSSPLRYKASGTSGLSSPTSGTSSPKPSRYPISPPVSAGLPPKPAESSRVVSNSLKEAPAMRGKLIIS